ncbi:MAG: hypothetical protein B6U78_02395 [Candidatus Aenigmarchaeota archaeon ex4484_224]|nr:MAG: hypothetical protein B6U78_02395 [Candidatus Aenigmarchaeota archaeon ex4484_224]
MRYKVKVFFRRKFLEIKGNEIKIGIKEKPIEGKANREIVKKLAKHFRVSTSRVRIIKGLKSREKIIEIEK